MSGAYIKWLKAADKVFEAAGHPSLFGLSKQPLPEDHEEREIMAAEADQLLERSGLGGWPPEGEVG